MFENIDEEYRLSLIACIECLKDLNISYLSSSTLILSFIHYEDSLLNEIYPEASFNDVLNFIIDNKGKFNEEDLFDVIKDAEELARSNGSIVIYDEYILEACLKKDSDAINLLEELGADIDKIKKEVINYLTDDNSYLTNLTKMAMEDKLDPFIGRDYYLMKIIRILSKKQKNNCLLIGNAGVGKSAIVEGLAIELFKRKSKFVIYRLDLGVIIAGTRYRGDLEERLVDVINSIKETNAILFIDEIHSIVSSGNSEGSLDIANILKPALARSEIKCIGATTIDEYYKYIEKDKALDRRFEKIFIPEATQEETLNILKGIQNKYEEYYNIKYNNKILKNIVEASKFFPNRKFPDKAIDLLDEVSAYVNEEGRNVIKINDLKKIVLENIGLIDKEKTNKVLNKILYFQEFKKYYDLFLLGLDARETILNAIIHHQDLEYLIQDLQEVFNITNENIYSVDIYDERIFENIKRHIEKYPISVVVLKYDNDVIQEFLVKYIYNNLNRKLSFKNTIIIFEYDKENDLNNRAVGYENNQNFIINKPKYIDEVIKYKGENKRRINNLLIRLKENNYKVIIDSNINDSDYDDLLKCITDNVIGNIADHYRIFKDENKKIQIS